MESVSPWVEGFVVREISPRVSNYRAEGDLHHFLKDHGIPGLFGVDTRALTLTLRNVGTMMGVISSELTRKEMEDLLFSTPSIEELNLVKKVTTREPYIWEEGLISVEGHKPVPPLRDKEFRAVVYDFGVKRQILRLLVHHGFFVEVVPENFPAEEVFKRDPHCVVLSNGPGDPRNLTYLVEEISRFVGKIPLFGICLGHQLLGSVLGGKIFKLKYGHHGANHPVKHWKQSGVWITSQNHNYAVDPRTLPSEIQITDENLNDGTLEGFFHPSFRILAVQYHPESSPGPHDARGIFEEFYILLKEGRI
jgi:carbamoyl-phosphate synthase small subunit